jgi:hypothetical protein
MIAQILEETVEWQFREAVIGYDRDDLQKRAEQIKAEMLLRRPHAKLIIRIQD